jgi:hypothetical protein
VFMGRILLMMLGGLVCVLLEGCAAVVHDPHRVVDAFVPGAVNQQRVQCLYGDEWAFNRSDQTQPPAFGVALSGGGMRSASYSMGVLKAMHERKELQQVDVISAVSGGAYTAGWYFAQKASQDVPPDDEQLFNDEGKRDDEGKLVDECKRNDDGELEIVTIPDVCVYQRHLEQHSKIVTIQALVAFAAMDVATIPVNLLTNFVFGWHLNTTPHRSAYEHVMGQEFFIDPVSKHWIDIKMPDIKPARGVPYLVINTTAAIADDINHHAAHAQNSVFEYTPQRYGSDAFGYLASRDNVTLHHVVSISGAALDLPSLTAGAAQKTLVSALNFDLGSYKNNYNFIESRPEGRTLAPDTETAPCEKPEEGLTSGSFFRKSWFHRLLPIPFYFFHHYKRDSSGLRVYLTDGGHSDNTGAFSLIRRMTGTVVIVDASQDPDMRFDDYYTLKRSVEASLHAKLAVPAIDRILEGKGAFDASHPVMVGSVTGLRYGANERPVKLVYIKLSVDRANDFAKYASYRARKERVKNYYLKHLHDRLFGHFPFQSTINQSYTSARYRAYRDLGYLTVVTDPQKERPIWSWEDNSTQLSMTSVTAEVCGAVNMNPTGVKVHQGEHLFLKVVGSRARCADGSGDHSDLHDCDQPKCAQWKDGRFTVGPDGWETWYAKPFWFLKRLRSAHWYELAGSVVGLDGAVVQSLPIGTSAALDIKEDGELFLFGNDASCLYSNNYGALKVEIRQFK